MSIYRSPDPEPVRVYTNNPDEPPEGRMFVWARTRWYERAEGKTGAVEFPHVADDDYDLRGWLREVESAELWELDPEVDEMARITQEEFLDRVTLYPEAPETSSEPPFQEQGQDLESEHIHPIEGESH